MSQSSPSHEAIRRRLTIMDLSASLTGALLTFLYFAVIDPLPAGERALQRVPPLGWAVFGAGMLLLFTLGSLLDRRAFGHLYEWHRRLLSAAPGAAPPVDVQRRALNFMPQVAASTFVMWVLAGLLFSSVGALFGGPLFAPRLLLAIVGVGGVVTTAIVYFAGDLIWQRTMPVFFPDGRLSAVPALRRPVLVRLLLAFGLIGIYPPALLVLLSLPRARVLVAAPNPETVLGNLVILELFILGASALASVGMAALVTRGITHPLHTLQAAMARVEQNDLQVTIPVTTNDELGYLGERFNQMTAGLREREHIRNMFGQYVTRQVAEAVLRGEVTLGGDRKEVTVLMSDLRDFTTLSESMPPEALVAMLNHYFDQMIDAVVEFEGTLDKFVGDAIVTEFNVPLAQDHHPLRAVLTALRMREKLAAFNAGQQAHRQPTLRMGIGIHTGPAVVGNIGSEGRKLEYTAMGDTVNVAARLEGLTKELGNDICISAETYACVGEWVAVSEPVTTTVKGREAPVTVYKLVGLPRGLVVGPHLLEMAQGTEEARGSQPHQRPVHLSRHEA